MVVPSNDFFIGNVDSPTEYWLRCRRQPETASIGIQANEILGRRLRAVRPGRCAFVGNNDLRRDQNGSPSTTELAGFNGLTTGVGYTFNSALAADSDVYRITFEATPVPERLALMVAG